MTATPWSRSTSQPGSPRSSRTSSGHPGPSHPRIRERGSVQPMSMGGLDPAISLAENYRVWAQEAQGRSPAYVELSSSVADDITILDFLGTLPPDKRQPNLLFASAYYLLGAPA